MRKNWGLIRSIRRWTSSTSVKYDYDVLICGGGVVGVTFASKLIKESKGSLKVGLIEQRPPVSLQDCQSEVPDVRVYALSHRTVELLKSIGAWEHVGPRMQPYKHMQIWDQESPGVLSFSASELNVPELGVIAEDRTIQASVYQSIRESPYSSSIDMLFGSTVLGLALPSADGHGPATVTLETAGDKGSPKSTRMVTSRLVVAADGGASVVRRFAGIPTWGWGYGQEAVVATLRIASPSSCPDAALHGPQTEPEDPHPTAWQRYLPTGPLGVLPLWGAYRSIVWSVPVPMAQKLKGLSEEEFLQELTYALHSSTAASGYCSQQEREPNIGDRLNNLFANIRDRSPAGIASAGVSLLAGPLRVARKEVAALGETVLAAALSKSPPRMPPVFESVAGPRVSFPLQLQQAKTYSSPRLALIGDAAHLIHPQAGQGLNLGFADASDLAVLLAQALAVGQDIGSHTLLQGYAEPAAQRALAMLMGVDTIHTMFGRGQGGADGEGQREFGALYRDWTKLRAVGMAGIHASPSIKNKLAKIAMGL